MRRYLQRSGTTTAVYEPFASFSLPLYCRVYWKVRYVEPLQCGHPIRRSPSFYEQIIVWRVLRTNAHFIYYSYPFNRPLRNTGGGVMYSIVFVCLSTQWEGGPYPMIYWDRKVIPLTPPLTLGRARDPNQKRASLLPVGRRPHPLLPPPSHPQARGSGSERRAMSLTGKLSCLLIHIYTSLDSHLNFKVSKSCLLYDRKREDLLYLNPQCQYIFLFHASGFGKFTETFTKCPFTRLKFTQCPFTHYYYKM